MGAQVNTGYGTGGKGGSYLADVLMSRTSEGWSLRPSLAMDAHPVPVDVPPGRDGAESCCGVGCCDGCDCDGGWDWE